MACSCFCSYKFLSIIFLLTAIPLALLISLETATPTTHVYHYHSNGFFRECAKWDAGGRRFLVTFLDGGIGQIPVAGDESPASVLEESVLVNESDLKGNASLGFVIDRPRNRLVVAISDTIRNRYSAVAAYDMDSWERIFLTQLSESGGEKTFADDLAVDAEGNAFITDVKGSKIWKVGVNGEFISTIKSPLFEFEGWYKNLFTLNGIVYHPDGYLLVIHTVGGKLFKIDLNKDNEIKEVNVVGGSLVWGDGLDLISPTKIVVAGSPTVKLLESNDNWESARIVGKFNGLRHRIATSTTFKDGKVYVSHLVGMGYPKKKHALVEAVFTS